MQLLLTSLLLLLFTACSSAPPQAPTPAPAPVDPLAWLEEVRGDKSLSWVKDRNAESLGTLQSRPDYKAIESDAKKIILAKDRLPQVALLGPWLYNFWQDEVHVRGIWRRTSLKEYKKKNPKWETVLDLDRLATLEKENWVFKGSHCLEPENQRCMMTLSRGGGDAAVVREFDVPTKSFVKGGFALPEAKINIAWVDHDHLAVATDFGPGSLTTSGYPRTAKIWTRGTPLSAATELFSGKKDDVSVTPFTIFTPHGSKVFVERAFTFYESELFYQLPDGKLAKVDKPADADMSAWIYDRLIITLKSNWKNFKSGDVVAIPAGTTGTPGLVFSPKEKQSVSRVLQIQDALILEYLDNIQGRLARIYLKDGQWKVEALPFPGQGRLTISSADAFGHELLVGFESFLVPSSILYFSSDLGQPAAAAKIETLKSLPARFNSSPYKVEQLWATSRDGTKVPYFVIGTKNRRDDGANPVLLYGYGGFEISQEPYYLSYIGKLWLDKGGTYVLANIRGGGEFGPAWHLAAIKQNRQKAYDDFIAIAEDLIQRKITAPEHLAISGRSNGGLLVSATFVQRPDLFHAVVCGVPLTDMLRYNKLLAGASWMAEYGDPDIPKERDYLLKYSPYQNVKGGVKYPEVFFMTSTMDDRVHPSHARKMAAKMLQAGNPLLYFENTEGGHSASANLQQRVQFTSLEYTFLRDRLLKRR